MQLEPFILKEQTLGALLDATITRHPDADAIIHHERPLRQTWAEFGKSVDDLAKGLMALGVRKGEKVAVWATNVPHWITLMFATARIGAVMVTVNTSYQSHDLEYLMNHSDSENLFMIDIYRDHDFIDILQAVAPEIAVQPSDALNIARLPSLRRVFLMGDERKRGLSCLAEVMALASRVSDADYEARKAQVDPYDVVNMQYTSGTTGFPKGVMLTHVNIVNNGYWIGRHQNLSAQDRVCLPVPLFHCFGCVLGVMAFVNHGAAMVIIEAFNPLQVLRAVEKERCTGLYGVPTMFLSILEHKHFKRYDVSTLRTGIMAGSVCPAPLMRRAVEEMNLSELTNCYGLTEGSPVMAQTHADEDFLHKTSTVGRAMPGIEVMVVDPSALPDRRVEVPRGSVGEVICKGYNIMKGYYKMPEATAEAITPEGWLRSGDLGTMDDDGYLVITGRGKDMIIRGGENIYPKEIEEFISGMDAVLDIQVVGVPSRKYGEEVVAFIILKPGRSLEAKDIRAFCKGRIAWYKIPRHVAFIDSYPLTGSGKIQKYKLREEAVRLFGVEADDDAEDEL
ncbi:AMP-binding protein [Desulfovibrio sp. OttesenSCG-928-A18]|nr:AMP-binding protein [Desulfovibrio sp. OttesenSCG-928-A18]